MNKESLCAMLLLAGIGLAPQAMAQQTIIGEQCSRPGPHADNRCTVLYYVNNNPSNNIVCLWDATSNALAACEGQTRWGGGYEYIPAAGTTLEFRRHANWPTLHPQWPDAQAVRLTGTLLRQQAVVSRFRATPTGACQTTVPVGGNIQAALNAYPSGGTICLASGTHSVGATPLEMRSNQTLRSANASSPAVLRPTTAGGRVINVVGKSNVSIVSINIDALASVRPVYGVLVYGSSNVLLERLKTWRINTPVGVSAGSLNVEIRLSTLTESGDGLAGGANPSIWINDSSDVRVFKTTIANTGIGPEGDGEIACYNTSNVAVHNTTVSNSGASGMYLVNCDRAVVIGNAITGSKEWGLDLVNTGQPSGTDYGLFAWNTISYSRNGGGVIVNSVQNTFQSNNYLHNRQGPNASGSCNGMNRRGNTAGYYYINDVADPWPVVCND